VRGTYLDKH
jgi:hypothetical protein